MVSAKRSAGLAAVAASVLLAGPLSAGGTEPATAKLVGAVTVPAPPNIVVILADDLDALITPTWDAMPKTAARVRDQGLTFTRAFTASSNCCPSRAALLTGEYPHNNGVLTNVGATHAGWSAFQAGGAETRTVARVLHDGGYRTLLAGKYMNGYEPATAVPPGWDEWYAAADTDTYIGYNYTLNENGTPVHYGVTSADYITDVLAAKAVDFIDRAEANDAQPFLAYLTPTAPHWPLSPPVRYLGNPWKNAVAPHPGSYAETDKSDKPMWLQWSAGFRAQRLASIDADYQKRMGSLLALDDLVASVLDSLEANGELDNTYVVFTSDNGYNFGAHGLVDKLVPYEESIHVPLVVVGPGITPGTTDALTVNIDLAPTLLQIAGIPVPATVDGTSLLPVITGQATSVRSDFLMEYATSTQGVTPEARWLGGIIFDAPAWRAVRNDTHIFIEWDLDGEMGTAKQYELYDLQADPDQLTNLIATYDGLVANIGTVIPMVQRLAALGACGGSSCRG